MKRQRYVNVTVSPAIPDNGRTHCFLMRSCSRCMVVWPLAKYNVVVALTALPPTATPMMPLSLLLLLHVARKPFQTDTWHCFCFFTCEVRALHKYSGKEALLSLPSALGMALERAEGIIREIGEAGSCRLIQLGAVGHSPKCSHSNLYVTAEIASERQTGNERPFSFPFLPSPKYPSQIQPATAALLVIATQGWRECTLVSLNSLT